MKLLKRVGFELVNRFTALKELKTYGYLFFGFFLIAGLVFPAISFLFYFSFLFPVYRICKGEATQSGLFYYLLPYFLMVGIGVWNYIFPSPIGIILSILLADLIALIISKVVNDINLHSWNFIWLPIMLFMFDFGFHKLPYLQVISMPSLILPLQNHLPVLKASSIWGMYLTPFLISLGVSAIAAIAAEKRFRLKSIIVGVVVLTILFMPSFLINSSDADMKTVKIAAVQGSYKSSDEPYNYYTQIIKDIDADIIVFPEVVMGAYDNRNKIDVQFRKQMSDFSAEKDALTLFTVIEGNSVTKNKEERFISSLLVAEDGVIGISHKRNLVPFAETGRYSAGRDYPVFDTKYGKIGVSICYDINMSAVERLKQNGAEIILAPFNDNGFGLLFHRTHQYDAVIQAAMNNIPIVMANEDGISQLVDENGNIIVELGIGKKGVLTHAFKIQSYISLYNIFGRFLELVLFAVTISGIVILGVMRVKK